MNKGAWLVVVCAAAGLYIMLNRKWTPPEAAQPYLADIMAAEYQYGMPRYLLARLLYQESRYRQDIIAGETTSSAGAVGIAQIVPRWHPEVDPLNPVASIYYAAKYLAKLKTRFGDWETALAAYNWGPTAVSNSMKTAGEKWLASAPTETQNYVSEIWGDVA
ncbi:lytic transglycosylase domain-containing protein [Rhodanobacter aciditrophus]|uniref:Lytic transglycosylase domain-containing protein n=1 Tax=Rhodanobacter aciditrophus TaxID=1623218 RepID=A0ABW4B2K4_9GAMM